MLIATDAPTPTSPVAPVVSGTALAVDPVESPAAIVTAPPLIVVGTSAETVATLCVSIKLTASDPATPTLVPPAPDVAFVVNLFTPAEAAFIPAPTSRLAADIPWPASVALFSTLAILMPTATPTPTSESSADPSAVTLAVFEVKVLIDALPAITEILPELIVADVIEVRSDMARAPTTDTWPSDVLAADWYAESFR